MAAAEEKKEGEGEGAEAPKPKSKKKTDHHYRCSTRIGAGRSGRCPDAKGRRRKEA